MVAATTAALAPIKDVERLQKLANILGKRRYQVDGGAVALLMQYLDEVGYAVLEQAALLCEHRDAKVVSMADVQLVLAKKYGIRIPGAPPLKTLHRETIRNSTDNGGLSLSDQVEKTEKKSRDEVGGGTRRGRKKKGA